MRKISKNKFFEETLLAILCFSSEIFPHSKQSMENFRKNKGLLEQRMFFQKNSFLEIRKPLGFAEKFVLLFR
jgi:hypothetical protein